MQIKIDLVQDGYDDEGEPQFLDIENMVATTITNRIHQAVEKHVIASVQKTIDEEIKAQVNGWVAKAIQQPLQETDMYGKPVGKPVHFETHAIDVIKKYISTKQDQYGRAAYDGKTPIAQILRTFAEEIIKNELAQFIKENREALCKDFAGILADRATKIGLVR